MDRFRRRGGQARVGIGPRKHCARRSVSPAMTFRPVTFPPLKRACQLMGSALIASGALGWSPLVLRAAEAPVSGVPNAATVSPAPVLEQPLPPAFSQEVPEPRPSAQHVWLNGHWRWREGNYVWIAPHWERPPVANATWIEPRWEKRENGYVLVEGYWQPSAADVATAPTSPPPQTATAPTVITEPPPPPPREVIVERPSPTHVWISGYWGWREGRHIWIPGHWEMPPRVRAIWVEPRWERRGDGYVLVEGYWREVGPGPDYGAPAGGPVIVHRPAEVVIVREPPPPPRREYVGPRPSPRHVWIDGYWAIRGGRNVWVAGRWEVPPRGRRVWEAPRWERRSGGYIFIEGSWR